MVFSRHKHVAAVVFALATAAAGALAQDANTSASSPEQIKRGAGLYAKHCESCHGVRMAGAQWGADLKAFPRDNPRRFVDSVTYGRNAMPPWGDVLSKDEIAALWAYVVGGEP